jgi:hypothetical protein
MNVNLFTEKIVHSIIFDLKKNTDKN